MKQVLLKKGNAVVEEVPCPQIDTGYVLVKVDYSCISTGTEMSGLKMSGAPLWKRALKQPENVKKVLQMLRTTGLSRTRSVVQGKLAAGASTGYSAAGTVIGVGDDIVDLKPNDRVACSGADHVHHAEVICVPRNLVVPVPAGVTIANAATVTLGAIALQGVRRANPTLGETFVVVGLGALGQLTAQLLKANGCTVIGIDLDSSRVALAKQLGTDSGYALEDENQIEVVYRLTHGIGADGVIVTASSPSNQIISSAFHMCRKKGRVVLVGNVGLHLKRPDIYEKELDFFISTSYGPGRYDNRYEDDGLDYPVAYVRWTENRNMMAYLDLLAANRLAVDPLISETVPIENASLAYEALQRPTEKPLIVLLSYPGSIQIQDHLRVINRTARPLNKKQVQLALIGAGGFAKAIHLPNIKKLTDLYQLRAVVSKSGHNAVAIAKQFKANYGSCDYRQVLEDEEVDAILIATRHHLHAKMVLEGLQAGKHVFVEKPLALATEELQQIIDFYEQANFDSKLPILMTGFNRRFSKFMQPIKGQIKQRSNPMILNYRLNAGYIPSNHWVHTQEGGGRNLGEACHIYDLFTFLTDSQVSSVSAQGIKPSTGYYGVTDNFVSVIKFADGSVATLTYTALGSSQHPKEQLEIFVDGKVIILNDYKTLTVVGKKIKEINYKANDKGQFAELIEFGNAVKHGGSWPIPLWQQQQATEIALQVEQLLREQQ